MRPRPPRNLGPGRAGPDLALIGSRTGRSEGTGTVDVNEAQSGHRMDAATTQG